MNLYVYHSVYIVNVLPCLLVYAEIAFLLYWKIMMGLLLMKMICLH